MAITDHVNVTLTVESVGIARAGFGVPLILSHNASFPDRLRFYTGTAGMITDGFATSSPEYLAAVALTAQSPKPARFAVGRATASVTQQYTLDAIAIRNSSAYSIEVTGQGFDGATATFTSDSAATQAEIHNGLVTALNAVTSNNYLAAFAPLVVADFTFTADNTTEIMTAAAHGLQTGDGPFQLTNSGGALPAGLATLTNYWVIRIDANTFYLASSLANALAGTFVTISGNGTGTHTVTDTVSTVRPEDPFTVTAVSAGAWFALEVSDVTALRIAQTHTVSNLADDLNAILLADGSWYCVITLYNSPDYVLDVAAWIESNGRIYVPSVNENEAIDTVVGSGNDTLKQLFSLGRARTMGCYHPSPAQFFDAAWMGRWLPTEPGAATPKFKTLSGVEPVAMTDTHRANLVARRANSYQTIAGRNITWEGTVPSTTYRFLDVVRNLDWHVDDLSKGLFGMLAGNDIIGFDGPGITAAEAEVRASVQRALDKKVATDTPAPTFSVPDVEDVSPTDKEERTLRDLAYSFVLVGALHKILVNGTVSF